jgi:large subunit ribosomal protein L19
MHGLQKFIDAVEKDQMKTDLPELKIGMTVKVGVTVVEGAKTRVQPYQGLIIAMHKHALNSTITVRKTFQGVGVERVFPVHSPLITVEPVVTAGVPRVRGGARQLPRVALLLGFACARALAARWRDRAALLGAALSARAPPRRAANPDPWISARHAPIPAALPRAPLRCRCAPRQACTLRLWRAPRRVMRPDWASPLTPPRAPRRSFFRACSQVRRAKLYYLRDRVGKAARLKQVFISTKPAKGVSGKAPRAEAAAPAAAVEAAAPEPAAAA